MGKSLPNINNFVNLTRYLSIDSIAMEDVALVSLFRKRPPEVSYKKAFLKIIQNSQENVCAGVSKKTLASVFQQKLW